MKERLSPSAQLLLWAYDRGSVPFDILCLVLVAILFLVPARFWGDPLTHPSSLPSAAAEAEAEAGR